ncbi:ArsR/SmtB family transcription factor [Tepidicaulis sp. LMO-SS28]|uniref:ArsR/SmtB family transcription factor n=1 Tax=Tepidicaulis sp. LMO-SS28 TaxID=3447455 RepID=UPI003EDF2154
MDGLVAGLRAAGEPTRLRLLSLLAQSELTVTELTQIMRQSQPRISRHLKLMGEAGLLDRFREGSWVFYRLARTGEGGALAQSLMALLPKNDPVLTRDTERLEEVRQGRAERAAAFFRENAEEWDRIRALYVPEARVEAAMQELAPKGRLRSFLDLGTGTGRLLEVFADRSENAVGIDLSPEMLAFARAKVEERGLTHCQVRQGDLFDLPVQDDSQDLVTLHQVLHYLDDPATALAEAARVLKPGGRLLIADFAPHELDFLREEQAHRRLGFAPEEVTRWCVRAGLEPAEIAELPPEGDEAKLTVVIWAAEKPSHGKSEGAARRALEEA